MQTITSYNYPNKLVAQFTDLTIFTVRNRVVYSKPIKVYQGIDNPIQVVILNQDQKPVNTTGYTVQVDIQDPAIQGSVASLAVTMANVILGKGTIIISKDVVNALVNRFYKLNVKLIANGTNKEQPLYVDDNYGALVDLEVLEGWYESAPVTNVDVTVIDGGTI